MSPHGLVLGMASTRSLVRRLRYFPLGQNAVLAGLVLLVINSSPGASFYFPFFLLSVWYLTLKAKPDDHYMLDKGFGHMI